MEYILGWENSCSVTLKKCLIFTILETVLVTIYFIETFYSFAKEIYPSNFEPSKSHHFIKKLEQNGKLLRNYSQNIDTLETKAGVERVVNCHGSFKGCTCTLCSTKYEIQHIEDSIFAKEVPYCKCGGVIKPDITFFGESLPLEFHNLIKQDLVEADLLIVIGTSLKVQPVCNVLEMLNVNVPQILVNRNRLGGRNGFDVELLGDCDGIIEIIEKELGWSDTLSDESHDQGELPWVWKFQGAVVDHQDDSSEDESSLSSADSCENDELEVENETIVNEL